MEKINIDWELIRKEYPKTYNKLFLYKDLQRKDYLINKYYTCYCDLEKFFDDNEIIIEIEAIWDKFTHFARYSSEITSKNTKIVTSDNVENRDIAKKQAILKAFEMMENKDERNID